MRSSLADAAGVCFFLFISLYFYFSCNPEEMRNCLTAPPRHPDGSNFLWTTSFVIRDKQQGVERNYRKKKKREATGNTWLKPSNLAQLATSKFRQLLNQQVEIQVPLNLSKVQGSVSKLREFQEISR